MTGTRHDEPVAEVDLSIVCVGRLAGDMAAVHRETADLVTSLQRSVEFVYVFNGPHPEAEHALSRRDVGPIPVRVYPLDSALTLLVVLQQIVIGVSLGFAVRIVFAAVEFAGELVGLQMGLNFAGFFDPATGGQTTAVSRFYAVTVSWLFIVTGSHLLVIAGVIQSFHSFPVGPEPFAFLKATEPHRWGAEVFAVGLWIALPLVAMLLFVNLVMGIVSRVAQQLNLFAIGFPITLSVGLVGVLLTLPLMQAPFTMALEGMLQHFH